MAFVPIRKYILWHISYIKYIFHVKTQLFVMAKSDFMIWIRIEIKSWIRIWIRIETNLVTNTTVYNRSIYKYNLIDVYKYNHIDVFINAFLESFGERKF
jgi:hypothetical protein